MWVGITVLCVFVFLAGVLVGERYGRKWERRDRYLAELLRGRR